MSLDQVSGGGVAGIPQPPPPPPVKSNEGKFGGHTVTKLQSVSNHMPEAKAEGKAASSSTPPKLPERKAAPAEGKPIVSQPEVGASAETEKTSESAEPEQADAAKPQKRTLREKVSHLFGGVKRHLKHEQWSQLPQAKIDKLPDKELRQSLESRNEKVQNLSDLKARAKVLESNVSQFEGEHKAALKALRDPRPPTKGVLVGGDGNTYNFKSLSGRAETFDNFKKSFEGSSEYKQYLNDYQELIKIPETRQELKSQLHSTNDDLKFQVDSAADQLTAEAHAEIDKRLEESGQKTQSGIQDIRAKHQQQLSGKAGEISDLQTQLESLKSDRKAAKQELRLLEAKFNAVGKKTEQALQGLKNKRKKLQPGQYETLKQKAIESMKQQREAILQQIGEAKQTIKSYPEKRSSLENDIKSAQVDLKKLQKGKDSKKQIKGLEKENEQVVKRARKDYKAAPKESSKLTDEMHKQLRGRNNKVK